MSSKLLINVNDANPVVVPDTDADTNAPDTGMFSVSHNDGVNTTSSMVAPIIGISVLVIVLIALIISLVKKHKSKKTNKFSIYSKGHTILRIAGIMTLILITTFVALNYNTKQEDNVNAASNTLTITASDIEIDVDLKDKAVFATGESVVTVDSATTAGYTLMAYVDSTTTDLTNETDKSSKSTISMLESTYSQALTDNTWGMAITKPTSQDSEVFRGLPTTEKEAMAIKVTNEATIAGDKSTFYYGTYITPDLDYGTYAGATITYVAVAGVVDNDVTVKYHMASDSGGWVKEAEDPSRINTVVYGRTCKMMYQGSNCKKIYTAAEPERIVKTPNLRDDGAQIGPYQVPEYDPETDEQPFLINETVTIPGADGIKVEVKYGFTGMSELIIVEGEYDLSQYLGDQAGIPEANIEMLAIAKESNGNESFVVSGDAVSIGISTHEVSLEGYDYGAYIQIYPFYDEQSSDNTLIEETSCRVSKSNNLDDNGNKVSSQSLGIAYNIINYSEADIIRAEMKYALNPVGILMTMDANDYQMLARTGIAGEMMQYFYGTAYGVEEGVSGEWTRNYYGNNIFFLAESIPLSLMEPISEPVVLDPNYDYGYYAIFYPIYAEEKPNTTPVQMCPVEIKSGSYYESRVHTVWTYIGEEESERYIFFRENGVKTFIDTEFDRFTGQTIDLHEVVKSGTLELI